MRIDISGQKFGKLVAISPTERRDNNRQVIWLCLCDCGNQIEVSRQRLATGHKTNCGCSSHAAVIKPNAGAAKHHLFQIYANGAQRNNRAFEFNEEEFLKITSLNCFYCGIPPRQIQKPAKGSSTHYKPECWYYYNGIDRIDNNLGYTLDNCVPCCAKCNYLKSHRNYYKFMTQVSKSLYSRTAIGRQSRSWVNYTF